MDDCAAITVVIPVFRDPERAILTTQAVLRQRLPTGSSLEIIVVDDGSGDETPSLLRAGIGGARLLELPTNMGRSAARNRGATLASGRYLLFLDCDCEPVGDEWLLGHIAVLKSCIASTGAVEGSGGGFWHRYQCEASERRRIRYLEGLTWSGSSQNMGVRREVFEKVGGFDTRYTTYGFEDRDLLMRISQLGPIGWVDGPGVRHLDELTFVGVYSKMRQAGGEASRLFSTSHAQAYKELGYAALDARLHPWLRPIAVVSRSVMVRPLAILDRLAERLPYRLAKLLAKSISAVAFLDGTSEYQGRNPRGNSRIER